MTTTLQLEKVREERTYHRGLDISLRHRCWGKDNPAVGANFIESDGNAQPVAVVFYKHRQLQAKYLVYTMRVHFNMAARLGIPYFLVDYDFQGGVLNIVLFPVDSIARTYYTSPGSITEPQLVRLLHRLRGKELSRSDNEIQEQIEQRWKEIK